MAADDDLKNALEKSLRLYGEMLRLSESLSVGLSSWSWEEIMARTEEVRNLRTEARGVDAEIERHSQDSRMREVRREYDLKRAEIIRTLLLQNRENLPVIERMLAMVRDEISQGRAFRHAADGYFGAEEAKGGLLIKTA